MGDTVVIKPGERVSLDGEIIYGTTSINQAPITGESIPVDKDVGDPVYAGTINEDGSIQVRVTKLVEDTTIAKIIHLVEEAQEKKAPTQAIVDRFAKIYTPIVFILAILTMTIPPLLSLGTWSSWFYKSLELLVIACPCALVISTPVAIVSAIGNAAKNGVLIKGGTSLEVASTVKTIAFDKTGTLTAGKPKVSKIITLEDSEQNLVSIARTIEEYSQHPIALAIVNYALDHSISNQKAVSFNTLGTTLQTKAIDKTRASIRDLMNLAPPEAWLKIGDDLIRTSVEKSQTTVAASNHCPMSAAPKAAVVISTFISNDLLLIA